MEKLMERCSNCTFDLEKAKTHSRRYTYNSTYYFTAYYCNDCFPVVQDEILKRNLETEPFEEKLPLRRISYETLAAENQKLKTNLEKQKQDFQIERESFEEALANGEKWHQDQLALKDKEISELKSLLQNQELANFNQRLQVLEDKFTAQIQINP